MNQPRIVGDTLRGIIKGPPSSDAPQGATYSLAEGDVLITDVVTLRSAKTSAGKSIGLGLGIVAGAFAVVVAAIALGGGTIVGGFGETDACFICGG